MVAVDEEIGIFRRLNEHTAIHYFSDILVQCELLSGSTKSVYADAVTTKPLELRRHNNFCLYIVTKLLNTSPGPAGWLECAL